MSQLKPSFVQEIKQTLEDSVFTLEDFTVDLPENYSTLINISFKYTPDYKMSMFETTENRKETTSSGLSSIAMMEKTTTSETIDVIKVKMSPGKYKSVDVIKIYDIGKLISYIPKWCKAIKDDLYAKESKNNFLDEMRKKFSFGLEKLVTDSEGYFCESDTSSIDEKFEALYLKISELQEEYSITQSQLDEVQKEFKEFKESARVYPQGIWAKITSNRLANVIGKLINSKEGRELIFDQVKKHFLGS